MVLTHFHSAGSHRFVDAAIVDPASAAALAASPSSASCSGVAAQRRETAKYRKYRDVCEQIGSSFLAGVVERFGACGDDITGFIKFITGDGDRDILSADDVTFSAHSSTTYVARHIVFSVVMADAAMVSEIIEADVHSHTTH